MQIEIDFDVFKALTAQLVSPTDTYNEAIRRALGLPASNVALLPGEVDFPGLPVPSQNALLGGRGGGVWFSDVYFPDGTQFRATYKGRTHRAQIQNSRWIDEFGNIRTSPSDAASAISKTNVNGWRFWFAKLPSDEDWRRMDEFKP